MNSDEDSMDLEELRSQVVQMMTDGIILIEKELVALRCSLGERSNELLNDCRNRAVDGGSRTALVDATRNFYKHAATKLGNIEETLMEHRINGRVDLVKEAKERLRPPGYTRSALRLNLGDCIHHDPEGPRTYEPCPCDWRNIPESEMDPTQEILSRKKPLPPSDFDLSDLKFKQELAFLRTKTFVTASRPERRRRLTGFQKFAPPSSQPDDSSVKTGFIKDADELDLFTFPAIADDLRKIVTLKFVDGVFKACELWKKLLDAHGQQLRSIWLLVVCPQIENMLKKHKVPVAVFFASKICNFLFKVRTNGNNFALLKDDLIPMLENRDEASLWFQGWRLQFKTIEGKEYAATAIQRFWRGYLVRKNIHESECKYIAASIIWSAWMMLKKKRDMHQSYLEKMLTMLSVTKELNRRLSNDYQEVINNPHVVIHLPSLGFQPDIRRTFPSSIFAIYQNAMSLKTSFLQNPNADVLYILPIKPSNNLMRMYYDIIESVRPNEGLQKRMTFLELSQADTFSTCSFNVSRTLYCSDETLDAIATKVAGRPAYFLPWILDECDVRIAGNLGIPLLSPNVDLQLNLINKSYVADMVSGLQLLQPSYESNVKDYATLCAKLAELICLNTEVCLWLIKLNVGQDGNQTGIFLINHISVPFMPNLRKEKARCGDEWYSNPEVRGDFMNALSEHLPNVVSNVTRLSSRYRNWKDFYVHLVKYGCLLQAVPNEKLHSVVTVTVFIPGESTGQKPKWTGTANQIHLESRFAPFGFMVPQTSVVNHHLEATVNTLAESLQSIGYFGYASIDLYCYTRLIDDQLMVLVIDVDPYYGRAQHFVDWFCFAIDGKYNPAKNNFEAGITVLPSDALKGIKAPTFSSSTRVAAWNETSDRYGVATSRLYHSQMAPYHWGQLKFLAEDFGIDYDPESKQGTHIVLHDAEQSEALMMSVINLNMKTALEIMGANMKNLNKAFSHKAKLKTETNLGAAAVYFANLAAKYQSVNFDKCLDPLGP